MLLVGWNTEEIALLMHDLSLLPKKFDILHKEYASEAIYLIMERKDNPISFLLFKTKIKSEIVIEYATDVVKGKAPLPLCTWGIVASPKIMNIIARPGNRSIKSFSLINSAYLATKTKKMTIIKKISSILLLFIVIFSSSCHRRSKEKVIEGKDGNLYIVLSESDSTDRSLRDFGNGVFYYTCPAPKSGERDVINKFGPVLSAFRGAKPNEEVELSPDMQGGNIIGYWVLTTKNNKKIQK